MKDYKAIAREIMVGAHEPHTRGSACLACAQAMTTLLAFVVGYVLGVLSLFLVGIASTLDGKYG